MMLGQTCVHECGYAFIIQRTALDNEILQAAADAVGAKHTNYGCQAAFDELVHLCLRCSRCRTELATAAGDVHMDVNEPCPTMGPCQQLVA